MQFLGRVGLVWLECIINKKHNLHNAAQIEIVTVGFILSARYVFAAFFCALTLAFSLRLSTLCLRATSSPCSSAVARNVRADLAK